MEKSRAIFHVVSPLQNSRGQCDPGGEDKTREAASSYNQRGKKKIEQYSFVSSV